MKKTTVFPLLLLVMLSGVAKAESCNNQFVREGEVDIPGFEQCLIDLIIPSGAVMAFDREGGCPDGWSLFTRAGGRVITGAGEHENLDENGARLTVHSAATTGGTETHTLTNQEMPEHRHLYFNPEDGHPQTVAGYLFSRSTNPNAKFGGFAPPSGGAFHRTDERPQGGNAAHNNMPPYIAL